VFLHGPFPFKIALVILIRALQGLAILLSSPMPQLSKFTLAEISSRFNQMDEFWFFTFENGMLSFICEKELTYKLTFFPSPFAHLEAPCKIDDLVAAIDEQQHYALEIIL
jgi:hypothetical protein